MSSVTTVSSFSPEAMSVSVSSTFNFVRTVLVYTGVATRSQ